MDKIETIKHSLVENSLTILRDKNTSIEDFRKHAALVSKVLFLEATKDLKIEKKSVETPVAPFEGSQLAQKVVVIPVLRAGLAMLFALQDLLPSISVGFIGLERDEETAIAHEYYRKIPNIASDDRVIILDPMLATGGSIDDTLKALKEIGIGKVSVISIVSAPEGLKRIADKYKDVTIFTTAIDQGLNDKKYIVPGLGDFGDRYFGTD